MVERSREGIAEEDGSERRGAPRLGVGLRARIGYAQGVLSGCVENLSATGAKFTTSEPEPRPAAGVRVLLTLLHGDDPGSVRRTGLVVRVDDVERDGVMQVAYGLRFDKTLRELDIDVRRAP